MPDNGKETSEQKLAFKEKFMGFVNSEKQKQTTDYDMGQQAAIGYASKVAWNKGAIPADAPRLSTPAEGQTRIDFTHGVSEADLEKSYTDRENTLSGFAQEKQKSLKELSGSLQADYNDLNYQNIRMLLGVLDQIIPKLSVSYQDGDEAARAEREKERQDWSKYYRTVLDQIYMMGDMYLKEHTRQTANPDFMEHQRKLVTRIMNEANDALLAAERMTLIQQEREYMQEDKAGKTFQNTEDDNEINELSPELVRAIEFYTSNDKYAKGVIGYQWLNGFYRGKYTLKDLPKGRKGRHLLDVMQKINLSLNRGQKESKRLYRGTDLTPAFGDQVQKPESLVGRSFSDKGYMSTSRNRGTARNFIAKGLRKKAVEGFVKSRIEHSGLGHEEAIVTGHSMLEIVSRKGAHSLDITSKSKFHSEEEVLFAPGTRMYIHSVRFVEEQLAIEKERVWEYLKNYHLERYTDMVMPQEWDLVFVKFRIPVYEVEIR